MPDSYTRICIHIVFSTKNREPRITSDYENKLHNYIGGICNGLNCNPIIVGGYLEHVHILCFLGKNTTISNLLEKIKSHSSVWMKTLNPELKDFYWQTGYSAFSCDARNLDGVVKYIKEQHVHHEKKSFKEELMQLFKEHNIPFDERYAWD